MVVKRASKPHLLVSNSPLYSLSSLSKTASPSHLRTSFSSISSFSAFNAKRDVKTKRFVPRPESAIIPPKKSAVPIPPAVQTQPVVEEGVAAESATVEDNPIAESASGGSDKMVVEKTAEKRKTATKPPDRTSKRTVEKAPKAAKKAGEKTKRTAKKTVEEPREEEEQTEATQPSESREALIARDIEREKRRLNAIVQEKTSAIVHSQMREEETSCVIFSQYEE